MRLDEFNRRELLAASSPEPWKDDIKTRAEGYTITYVTTVLNEIKNQCLVVFRTQKAGHTTQYVKINLDDFWEQYNSSISSSRRIQTLVNLCTTHGELHIFCTCPAWLYSGNKYMATKLDYEYGDEEHRFPRIRNPKLLGSICKHVYAVLKLLPNNAYSIAKDIRRELGVRS